MRRRTLLGLAALLLPGAVAAAAAPSPDAFARFRPIDPVGESAVQRLILPSDVYAWTSRPDLGDLRVFNGAGQPVPHAVAAGVRPPDEAVTTPVPTFPLPAPGTADALPAGVNVEVREDGRVVAVRAESAAPTPRPALLLDVGALSRPAAALLVDWPDGAADAVIRLRVDASDDLDDWRPIVPSATVARLTADGHRVEHREIALPPTAAPYLRLVQIGGEAPLAASGISARVDRPRAPPRHWLTVPGVDDDGAHEFDGGGRVPADRLDLALPRDTYLADARVYGRDRDDAPWRLIGQQTFYRVAVDDVTITAEPMAVPALRYWRLDWLGEPPDEPTLRLGWRPRELWFLRQGPPPFRLAYGLGGLAPEAWPMQDLADRLGAGTALDTLPAAVLGEPVTVGGRASLEAPPEPVDWRTLLLWAVLVAGVAAVAWLATRVLR